MKMPGHGYSLLSSNGLFGFATKLDMSDRTRTLASITLPESESTLTEVTSENATGREYKPAILASQQDVEIEMDFLPPRSAGGVSDFLLFFPRSYNEDDALTVEDSLFKNTLVWAYNATASKVGGGQLSSGGDDTVNSTATMTINGGHNVYPTFDCATGYSTLEEGEAVPVLAADGTTPVVPATNDDVSATQALTMYAIRTGFYDFVTGALATEVGGSAIAVTEGDKIVYSAATWTLTSGSF